MTFVPEIPLSEIRPGDYFDANIETLSGRYYPRRCQAVEIVEPNILRVKTATRSMIIAITRDMITSKFAWGER